MVERLLNLIHATDKVIDLAMDVKSAFGKEAINFADLCCVDAARVVHWDGTERDMVVIAEAAPECPVFAAFVAHHLAEAGWTDVEVRTEW